MEKKIPMFAVATDEVKGKPIYRRKTIDCPHCGKRHKLKCGQEVLPDGNKKEDEHLKFYNCGKSTYLAVIDGVLMFDIFEKRTKRKQEFIVI